MTTIIEHPEHGRVEGVELTEAYCIGVTWTKYEKGVRHLYMQDEGWREVSPAVDVTDQFTVDTQGRRYGLWHPGGLALTAVLNGGYSWHKTKAVVLPEDWVTQFNIELGKRGRCISDGCRGDIQDVLHLWEQSVLLIKKEGGG